MLCVSNASNNCWCGLTDSQLSIWGTRGDTEYILSVILNVVYLDHQYRQLRNKPAADYIPGGPVETKYLAALFSHGLYTLCLTLDVLYHTTQQKL